MSKLALPGNLFHKYYEEVAQNSTPLALMAVPRYLASHSRYGYEEFIRNFGQKLEVYSQADVDGIIGYTNTYLRTSISIPARTKALMLASSLTRKSELIVTNVDLFYWLEMAKFINLDPESFVFAQGRCLPKNTYMDRGYWAENLIIAVYDTLKLL